MPVPEGSQNCKEATPKPLFASVPRSMNHIFILPNHQGCKISGELGSLDQTRLPIHFLPESLLSWNRIFEESSHTYVKIL